MHILVINPNSTASMTAGIAEAARSVAAPGTRITATNPETGPAAIQGPEDGEAALPGLLALFESEMDDPSEYDAVVIACFDDTGLDALRARSPVPVIAIGEAAFHLAVLTGPRFSVVTTLAVSVPIIERNLRVYGFADRCASVRATGIPVLELEATVDRIAAEAGRAVAEDACDTIVLGCAGMADMAPRLSGQLGRPVVDGVAAAVALCESIHRLGLCNHRLAAANRAFA